MFVELLLAVSILLTPTPAEDSVSLDSYIWNGTQLTAQMGVNFDCPMYAETWYDEPMDSFIHFLYDLGWEGYHWIRNDGVHMWHNSDGDFVMIGAYLPKYPRGTYLPTSRGMGIVADTGYFYYGEDQIDIATIWRSYL